MSNIRFTHKGNLSKTYNFCEQLQKRMYLTLLEKYGEMGVEALSAATPVDTGKTAESWSYEIEQTDDAAYIYFNNSNVNNGVSIAIILQYGHGTRNGGYVQGRDYINPAIQPIFDNIVKSAWEVVAKV